MRLLRYLTLVLPAIVTAMGVVACNQPPAKQAAVVATVTAGEIAEYPDRFRGRRVRIERAEVENVRTRRLFTLDEDEPGAAPDVMVLVPQPTAGRSIENGQRVTVVGTVREMSGAAFRRDYHWWDEGAFTTEIDMIGSRPVIVAESVRTVEGTELVAQLEPGSSSTAAGQRRNRDRTGQERDPDVSRRPPKALPSNNTRPVTAVEQIARNPQSALLGRAVEIDGVEIVELVGLVDVPNVASAAGFWIQGASGERAFVLPGGAVQGTPRRGERVSIDGVIMGMPATVRERLGGKDQSPTVYVFAWAITPSRTAG